MNVAISKKNSDMFEITKGPPAAHLIRGEGFGIKGRAEPAIDGRAALGRAAIQKLVYVRQHFEAASNT
jgi:hypothetical protein